MRLFTGAEFDAYESQDRSNAGLVEVSGLKPPYTSCELVSFAVKNISQQELYLEVYAENFESGSWTEGASSYDIRDPRSLYIMKRVNIHPDRGVVVPYLGPLFASDLGHMGERR